MEQNDEAVPHVVKQEIKRQTIIHGPVGYLIQGDHTHITNFNDGKAAPSKTDQHTSVAHGQQRGILEIFLSYERSDEASVERLRQHLAVLKQNKLITDWYARNIVPGQKTDEETMKHLNRAHIILLLVSASFIASERQCLEVQQAMKRSEAQDAIVIPILLHPIAHLQDTSFGKLQVIPKSGKPVSMWTHREAAFAQVASEIGEMVKSLKQ